MRIFWSSLVGTILGSSSDFAGQDWDPEFDKLFDFPLDLPQSPQSISHPLSPNLLLARGLIMEEILAGRSSSMEAISSRLEQSLPRNQWLSIDAIHQLKSEILRPTVQPLEFHKLLWDAPHALDSEIAARMPPHYSEYRDMGFVQMSMKMWKEYCIDPLRSWGVWAKAEGGSSDPLPCQVVVVENQDGSVQRQFELSQQMINKFLRDQLASL